MKKFSKIIPILSLFIIPCILSLFSLNTISCTKTVTEVVHDTTIVVDTTNQNFVYCELRITFSAVRLYFDPIPEPDSVNAIKLWNGDSTIFPIKLIYPDRLQLEEDPANNTACSTYSIKLITNLGNAEGTITVPEGISITQPSMNDTLPIGEVTILWTVAQGADFYWIDGWLIAYDSLGYGIESTEFLAHQTTPSYSMPSSFFQNDSAVYYNVFLAICAYSGPVPIPGANGNFVGTLNGFLNGIGSEDQVWFNVGTPIKKKKQHYIKRELSLNEKTERFLHSLSIK